VRKILPVTLDCIYVFFCSSFFEALQASAPQVFFVFTASGLVDSEEKRLLVLQRIFEAFYDVSDQGIEILDNHPAFIGRSFHSSFSHLVLHCKSLTLRAAKYAAQGVTQQMLEDFSRIFIMSLRHTVGSNVHLRCCRRHCFSSHIQTDFVQFTWADESEWSELLGHMCRYMMSKIDAHNKGKDGSSTPKDKDIRPVLTRSISKSHNSRPV